MSESKYERMRQLELERVSLPRHFGHVISIVSNMC